MLAKFFSSLLIILGLVSSSTPPVTIKTTTSTIPTFASTSDIIVDSKIEQVATPNSSASDSKILFEFVDSTSSPEVVDPYKILHDWEASTSLPWNILTATTGINISIVDTWSKLGGLQKSYKLGSRGEMIVYLQHALKIITNTFKKESPSGYYGPTTEQAIKELQQKFGLKPSGITEPATRYLINKFYYNQLCPKPNRKFPDLLLADVNKKSSLPPDYVPEDLVNIDTEDIQTRGVLCLRQEAATALQDIFTDAKNLGFDLRVTSAFRKPELQKYISTSPGASKNYVARPFYSEHQLGTAIDITSKSVKYRPTDLRFGETLEGKWLLENAWRYGFVLSYPKGKNTVTGYNYEPWHIRYVGQDLAQILHEQNLTYTEYVDRIMNK